jgi:hypothetical protein
VGVRRALSAALSSALYAVCGFTSGAAHAEPLRVAVTRPTAEPLDAVQRVIAELRSAGYVVSSIEAEDSSPCASGDSSPLPLALPAAFIRVETEVGSGVLTAVICYARRERSFEQTAVSAATNDHDRLSLSVVEALNGLKAEPRQPPAPSPSPPPLAPSAPSGSGFVNTALAFDPRGPSPLAGFGFGLATSVDRRLSLELDVFASLREGTLRGYERDLTLDAGWARLGPQLSWVTAPLRFAVSVQAGAAWVWVSARTKTPNRVGTTVMTTSALVSSGLTLECPTSTLLYFRAAGRVSRLLPGVEVARGDGTYVPFGALLVDMSVGFGIRWGAHASSD